MPSAERNVLVVRPQTDLPSIPDDLPSLVQAGITGCPLSAPADRLEFLYHIRPGEQPYGSLKGLPAEIPPCGIS